MVIFWDALVGMHGAVWGGIMWGHALRCRAQRAQLLRNLREGVTTLHVCGDWAATDDAVLDMSTDAVWVQGRAARKRISALQARRAVCLLSDVTGAII